MSDFQKDLQEAIEKHLPQQLGESLRKRINIINQLEEENKQIEVLKKENNKLQVENTENLRQIKDFAEQKRINEEKEKELNQKLRECEIEIMKCRLIQEHAIDKVNFAERIFSIPFKNRILRESTLKPYVLHNEYISQGLYDSNACRNTEHICGSDTIDEREETKSTEEG